MFVVLMVKYMKGFTCQWP